MSPDRVTERLDALRRDVDRLGMADSGAIRRRGEQRTRNQVVGGTVAVAVVVAGVIGLSGAVAGNDQADVIPATPTVTGPADVTPTTTASPEESVSTTVEPSPSYAVADDPFLRASDLTDFGGYDEAGPFLDAGAPPDLRPKQCAVRPFEPQPPWTPAATRANRYYQDGSEVSLHEYVLQFDTAAQAREAAVKGPSVDLLGAPCAEPDASEGQLTTRTAMREPSLADAWRWSRYFVPSVNSEPSYHEVATARAGTVVVMLEWMASGNPREDTNGWAFTPEHLEAALDRALAD